MNPFFFVIANCLLIALFIPSILQVIVGQGRRPDRMDQTLCKVLMYNKLDKIQENEDPRARVEAYFNITGHVCKTYCRIRSANKELNKIMAIFEAPIYTNCANERYCAEGGKCKKIGSITKTEKQPKKIKETPKEGNSTENTLKNAGEEKEEEEE